MTVFLIERLVTKSVSHSVGVAVSLAILTLPALAEVCDKGNWDFESTPRLVMITAAFLGIAVFVTPAVLSVLSFWKMWRKTSLIVAAYFLFWTALASIEWYQNWAGNDAVFNEMLLEGCGSYKTGPILTILPLAFAFLSVWNYIRLRKKSRQPINPEL